MPDIQRQIVLASPQYSGVAPHPSDVAYLQARSNPLPNYATPSETKDGHNQAHDSNCDDGFRSMSRCVGQFSGSLIFRICGTSGLSFFALLIFKLLFFELLFFGLLFSCLWLFPPDIWYHTVSLRPRSISSLNTIQREKTRKDSAYVRTTKRALQNKMR